ncbi:MAG: Ig-like domain-containing protein [Rhodothermales bacterium]|nr:Ig-like domain-containing protein [Rhodothermales bacterium]
MKSLLPLLLAVVFVAAFTAPVHPAADGAAPIARDDTAGTTVGTPVDVFVLVNDEETNPAFSIVIPSDGILTAPEHGTAAIKRNGTPGDASDDFIRYTPDAGFVGKDSLQYQIESNSGAEDEAWVFLFVGNPPEAAPDVFQVLPGRTTRLAVLANDSDPEGDPIRIDSLTRAPNDGTAAIVRSADAPDAIDYTPDAGFIGRDTLRYRIEAAGLADSALVEIIVNTPPNATNDAAATTPGTAVDVDVLDNDLDPEGGALTVAAIASPPAQGTATIIDGGQRVRYTPPAGFAGTVTFTYTAEDPLEGQDTATVTVTVNTAPVAQDDAASTLVDQPVEIAVLANDTDADGQTLTIDAIASPPAQGTATIIDGGQRVRYTPPAGFAGTVTFTYTAEDPLGGQDTATVTVTVRAEALVQLIHNLLDAGAVDVYVDGMRVADDLDFREATPYLTLDADGTVTIDVTEADAADNSDPLFTGTAALGPNETYVVVVNGVAGENAALLVTDQARTTTAAGQVDVFVVHGAPGAGQIDLRQLDPDQNNDPVDVLANNLGFNTLTPYRSLEPSPYNFDVTNFDGTTVFDAFRIDFTGQGGQTFVLLVSGRAGDALTLLAVGADGTVRTSDVVTSTGPEAELPAAFALHGNYPNPFNPATTLRFDLPAPADVTVEVVDLLGRVVLTRPAEAVAAGAGRTLRLDASALASGTYVYRVVVRTTAETLVRTGRMTLVK